MKNIPTFNDLYLVCGLEKTKKQLIENVEQVLTAEEELHKLVAELSKIEDPCESFRLSFLPPVLQEYVSAKIKVTDAHPIMITLSTLITISAFIGRKTLLPKPHFFQDLHTNIWALCVTESGLYKSTALNSGAALAQQKQVEVLEEINTLKRQLFETNNEDEQSKIKRLIEAKSKENVILPQRVTGEAFLKLLGEGRTGAIFISELGPWLQNQQKKYNNDFRGTLTDLYDVPKVWENRTKTQGVDILKKPHFSIFAVSAPTWVRDNIKMDDIHSGFFARWLIFTPPSSDKMSPGLPKKEKSFLAKEAENKLEKWLDKALESIGEQRLFKISEEAEEVFDNADPKKYGFHQRIIKLARSYPNHKILEPFIKRWSPTLLKLAMIMQLLEDPDSTQIEIKAMYSAFCLIIPAIKSTVYLLKNVLGENPHEHRCKKLMEMIIKFIGKRKTIHITRKQIFQWAKNIDCLKGGSKIIDPVIDTLLERGELAVNKNTQDKNSWEYTPQKIEN